MVVTRKLSQSYGIWIPFYGSCKEIVSKIAEYDYRCLVVKRHVSQSCRIWIPLYASYKEILSKLRNMNTILWYLQGNCLKVAEYEYHSLVVTGKLFQSCRISIALYCCYKETVSKLRNINTILRKLTQNCFKVAECEYHCKVVTSKLFQSCGMWMPPYGSYKPILSKLTNVKTIVW